ncbi:MAG: ABC transporter permease [Pseudomonadota bacterium]
MNTPVSASMRPPAKDGVGGIGGRADANELPTGGAADGIGPKLAFGSPRFGSINVLGVWTLYQKEVRRFLKVAFQTVVAPVISTLLFLFVFMQAFGANRGPIAGVPYIEFLAPGLIMMAILTNGFANSSSSLIISKVQGSIVDVLTPPLSPFELTVAFVMGAATRGLLVGIVTAVTSALFMATTSTPMGIASMPIIAYFAVSAALMFSMLGVIAGIWAEKFDQLSAVTNFIITPLTFLSGTFYAVRSLPDAFVAFSRANPVFYLIDGFRSGFTGNAEASVLTGIAVTLVVNIVLAYTCYSLFKSGWRLKS